MKYLYLTLLLLLVPLGARGANTSFDSFRQPGSGFTVNQPYIYAFGTNSSSTNIFIDTLTIYTNATIQYFSTTNFYDNSVVIYTNSTSVTLNGTNLATINPTIGRIPRNADGTNFLDSALYYIDPDTVGANQLQTDLLVFNPAPTQALALGVNLLNPFEVSYMPLTATTTTATDTQIRLSTGNGVGSLLVIQNYDDHAFELLNGDELWDDPTAHLYLSGGDWTPSALGESILLIGNSVGWAEIGRFGGSTNVVSESLWQYSGGYLQPVNLTQPLFWTNAVYLSPGKTNALFQDGVNLTYSAYDPPAGYPYFVVTNLTEANAGWFGAGGNLAVVRGASGVGLIDAYSSGNEVRWAFHTIGSPSDTHVNLGGDAELAGSFKPLYRVNQYTNNVYGFIDSTGTNYARLAVSHTGTNGYVLFTSQAAGSAGSSPMDFDFEGATVNINANQSGSETLRVYNNGGSAQSSVRGGLSTSELYSTSLGTSNPIQVYGSSLQNNQSATSLTPQNSPAISWLGHGWSTNAATSQDVVMGAYLVPASGNLVPSGQLLFKGWYNDSTNQTTAAALDLDTTATNTRLLLWDVSAGSLKRVSVGANDSGGAGFKVLRVAN